MTLRRKTLIIIGATCICVVAILYSTAHMIMRVTVAEAEETMSRRNIEQVLSTLSGELSHLDDLAVDWATWDDTYAFIEGGNDNYIESNLADQTFADLRLNLMLFVDSSGRIVFGKGFDGVNKKEVPVPKDIMEHISPEKPLLRHRDTESGVTGLVLLPEGPMLVASRLILTSEKKGPARGTLIMGRYLDAAEVNLWAETTHSSLTINSFYDAQMPPDFQVALSSLLQGEPVVIQPLNAGSIAGYTLLRDIDGKPAIALKATMPRVGYQQGLVAMFYALLALLVIGLLVSILFSLIMEKVILSRLARLSASVTKIGTGGDLSKRVPETGRDEIACLAGAINGMLAALEQSQTREERYRKLADKLRAAHRQLQDIIEFLPDPTFVIDNDKKVIAWNRAIEEMTGVSKGDIIGKGDYDYAVPFYGKPRPLLIDLIGFGNRQAELQYENVERKGNTLNAEVFVPLLFEGKGAFLRVKAAPLFDSEGKLVGAIESISDVTRRKRTDEALRESEARLRQITDNMLDMICLTDTEGIFRYVSPSNKFVLGYEPDEMLGRSVLEFAHPDDLNLLTTTFSTCISTATAGRLEFRYRHVADHYLWLESIGNPLFDDHGNVNGTIFASRNITARKRMEHDLNLQKAYFQQLFENSPEGIVMLDNTDRIIDANKGFERLFQYPVEEIKGRCLNEVIVPEGLYEQASASSNAILEGEVVQEEIVRKRKDGSLVDVQVLGYPILVGDKQMGICAIYSDITERKKAIKQLKYLSLHDHLTGLYNRNYFEEEMRRFDSGRHNPVGIIMCDVDGLKLVNDTMGHETGDALLVAAAGLLRKCLRENDVVARIGGDEFAIMLPCSDNAAVASVCQRIRGAVARYNERKPELPLSISIGYAASGEAAASIIDLFKEADNNMYREKLHRSQSAKSAIVQTLMLALEARDFITEGHADRLQELVANMGVSIGLPERRVTDLRLLAQFHDIGKVGIPDRILFKEGPLTHDEKAEMQRHSEIGYRIAQSSPDLVPVADWILKHHEWWNGTGYPLGLIGEEIPLECRILAIADAYDAMTSDRPYRKAMSPKKAVIELTKNADIQFDPHLVPKFVQVLKNTSLPGTGTFSVRR